MRIAHDVFTNAFAGAMRPTLLIGVGVVVVAAVASLLARATPTARAVASQTADQPAETPAAVA